MDIYSHYLSLYYIPKSLRYFDIIYLIELGETFASFSNGWCLCLPDYLDICDVI